MRRLIIVLLLFAIYYSLSAVFAGEARAAESEKRKSGEDTSAARVIEAANERLLTRVESLADENSAFRDKIAALEGERTGANRDRDVIFGKIKIVTQENAKLKEEVGYLQSGIVDLDNANKRLAEEKNNIQERNTQLEKELEAARELKPQVSAPEPEAKKRYGNKVKGIEPRAVIDRLEEEKKGYIEENKKLRNDLKEALSGFAGMKRASARLKREAADMHYNLGVILQGQNKYDEAIREYEKVLESRPDDAAANFNLALIYDAAKNKRDEAIEHYRKYLKIGPEAEDALKVKERLNELEAENKVWGEPGAKGIRENKGRW